MLIFTSGQLADIKEHNIVFVKPQFRTLCGTNIIIRREFLEVNTYSIYLLNTLGVKSLCALIILVIYRDYHIAKTGAKLLNGVIYQPVELRSALIEVKAVSHIYDIGAAAAGFPCGKPCHNAHNRFISPNNVPILRIDELFQILIPV